MGKWVHDYLIFDIFFLPPQIFLPMLAFLGNRSAGGGGLKIFICSLDGAFASKSRNPENFPNSDRRDFPAEPGKIQEKKEFCQTIQNGLIGREDQ